MANREDLGWGSLLAVVLAAALQSPATGAELNGVEPDDAEPDAAALFFASFHSYEPIAAFEFEPGTPVPAVGIVYLRSPVGGRFTDIRVSIDDPDFRLTAHTCRTMLENGSSCMIYFAFEPARGADSESHAAALEVRSREGAVRLPLSAHGSIPVSPGPTLR